MEVNMLNLPKTREQARQEGSKAYFTGLFCKQGHISKRWVATGNCAECQQKRTKNWTDKNPERVKAYLNSDEMQVKRKEYAKNFYQANRDYYIAKDAKRRATKLQATTKWGQEGVRAFYKKAKELQAMNLGTKYHVDHIVPLVGNNVCGLHNQFNLQILTASENWHKGNKHGT
jgi:5-methylcytosine-specific restriction endonuclease McrA